MIRRSRFRRCFQIACGLLLAGLDPVPVQAELPGPQGEPAIPVIDMHTHVFNGRDLPLAGILNAFGAPLGVSHSLAKLLNAWTAGDDLEDPIPQAASISEAPEALWTSALANTRAEMTMPQADSLFAPLSPEEQAGLLEFVGQDEPAAAEMALSGAKNEREREIEIVALALRKIDFPPGETDDAVQPAAAPLIAGAGAGGYTRFLGIMTKGHLHIAHRLLTREYPKVDLFVHHMMDMERAYASKPVVAFEEQMNRMTRLDRRFDGKLLHFVAFDPFRRGDSLDSVRRGLRAGALGVKFYPPSGYRATGNEIPPQPGLLKPGSRGRWKSRYFGLSNAALDALNEALFVFCEREQIPIFTHCTPHGFEAEKGYGAMADPQYWAKILERHKTLRLCFGHSGGDAYWFQENGAQPGAIAQRRFGEQVVELCLAHPNVYCEAGYLEKILDPGSRALFQKQLAAVIERRSSDGKWAFGHKLMYGTDWHMIHKEARHEQFPAAFQEAFAEPRLGPWQRPFFARNAVAFLKLAEAAKDSRFSEAQREYWKQLVTRAEAGPKSNGP